MRVAAGALALLLSACGDRTVTVNACGVTLDCTSPPPAGFTVELSVAPLPGTVGVTNGGPAFGPPIAEQEITQLAFDPSWTARVNLVHASLVSGSAADVNMGTSVGVEVVATRPSLIPLLDDVVARGVSGSGVQSFALEVAAPSAVGMSAWRVRAVPQSARDRGAYPPARSSQLLDPAEPVLYYLLPSAVQMSGHVSSALAAPRGGVTVRALSPSTGELISNIVTTDEASGAFTLLIGRSARSELTAILQASGGQLVADLARSVPMPPLTSPPDPSTVVVPTPYELREPALPTATAYRLPLTGHLPGGATQPIAGAWLEVQADVGDGITNTLASYRVTAVTDGDGYATLPLVPGDSDVPRSYRASVRPPPSLGLARGGIHTFEVGPACQSGLGCVLAPIVLDLRPAVIAQILDAGGTPVRGAVVTARIPDPTSPTLLTGGGDDSPQAITDDTGRFLLRLEGGTAAPATYSLEIQPPPSSGLPVWSIDGVAVSAAADPSLPAALVDLGVRHIPVAALAHFRLVDEAARPAGGLLLRVYQPASADICPPPTACPPLLRGIAEVDASGLSTLPLVLP